MNRCVSSALQVCHHHGAFACVVGDCSFPHHTELSAKPKNLRGPMPHMKAHISSPSMVVIPVVVSLPTMSFM